MRYTSLCKSCRKSILIHFWYELLHGCFDILIMFLEHQYKEFISLENTYASFIQCAWQSQSNTSFMASWCTNVFPTEVLVNNAGVPSFRHCGNLVLSSAAAVVLANVSAVGSRDQRQRTSNCNGIDSGNPDSKFKMLWVTPWMFRGVVAPLLTARLPYAQPSFKKW